MVTLCRGCRGTVQGLIPLPVFRMAAAATSLHTVTGQACVRGTVMIGYFVLSVWRRCRLAPATEMRLWRDAAPWRG